MGKQTNEKNKNNKTTKKAEMAILISDTVDFRKKIIPGVKKLTE